jgi:hypothetical protein
MFQPAIRSPLRDASRSILPLANGECFNQDRMPIDESNINPYIMRTVSPVRAL